MHNVTIKIQRRGGNYALVATTIGELYTAVRYDVRDTDDRGRTITAEDTPYYVFQDDVGERVGLVGGFLNSKVIEVQ